MRAFINLTVDRLDCYVDTAKIEALYRVVGNRGCRIRLSSGEVMTVEQSIDDVMNLLVEAEVDGVHGVGIVWTGESQ